LILSQGHPIAGEMTMTADQRIERLERQNRWMRRVGVLAMVGIAALLFLAQTREKRLPDLKVRSLAVLDEKGRVRASIAPHESGVGFMLSDVNLESRLMLGVWGTPYMTFWRGKNECLTLADLKDDGRILLVIHDPMTLKLAGAKARFTMQDSDGKVLYTAPE